MISPDLAGPGPQAVRLADWGLLRARGQDAATFLHSQLTQDIAGLPEGQARLAGWCSPKGRLLASFIVWRTGPDEILLACSADVLPGALKRLSMFVLRAKCKLDDASADLALWGLMQPRATDIPDSVSGMSWPGAPWRTRTSPAGTLVRLDDAAGSARALWVASAGAPAPGAEQADAGAWNWLEVQSGVPRIVARTADAFVPQMINFELAGGVHFQKGCYPGQEVVARSQYRGTVKRRMFLAEAAAAAEPGAEVFSAADPSQPAGRVVLAAARPGLGGTHAVLLEAKRELAETSALHLGAPAGPVLELRPLPYDLPADAPAG